MPFPVGGALARPKVPPAWVETNSRVEGRFTRVMHHPNGGGSPRDRFERLDVLEGTPYRPSARGGPVRRRWAVCKGWMRR